MSRFYNSATIVYARFLFFHSLLICSHRRQQHYQNMFVDNKENGYAKKSSSNNKIGENLFRPAKSDTDRVEYVG